MKTTIDMTGRVVVPKRLRDALGLQAGEELDIRERDGSLIIEPIPVGMRLVRRSGHAVIEADRPLPPLSADVVRETLESIRR